MMLSETVDTDIDGTFLTSTGLAAGTGSPPAIRCRAYWEDFAPWSIILKNPCATVEGFVSQEFVRGFRGRPVKIFVEYGTETLRGLLQAKVDMTSTVFSAVLPLASGVSVSLASLLLMEVSMDSRARVTGGIIPGLTIVGKNLGEL